jgi:hypothetical protein
MLLSHFVSAYAAAGNRILVRRIPATSCASDLAIQSEKKLGVLELDALGRARNQKWLVFPVSFSH